MGTKTVPECVTDGGRTVLYEETLSKSDTAVGGTLLSGSWLLMLFVVLSFVGSLALVLVATPMLLSSGMGGPDVFRSFVDAVLAEQSALMGAILVVGLVTVVGSILVIVLLVRRLRGRLTQQVTVRVTDEGLSVERPGSHYWQSSGVSVPFASVTAVEYLDPDESSFRVELGDWRAPKFFAGRSKQWVRIDRSDGPAVYVGSDQPQTLAETLARNAPDVKTATPY